MTLATASRRRPIIRVPRMLSTRTQLPMRIERWDVRRDGPLTQPALEQKLRALRYDPVLRTYPTGAVIATQRDAHERVEAVISGFIKVTIEGDAAILTAGDMVFVPRGASPRIEVIGVAPALCLEAGARER
jgi:mannose-6-phosphate isomerase-like protein (cupin superfamily)